MMPGPGRHRAQRPRVRPRDAVRTAGAWAWALAVLAAGGGVLPGLPAATRAATVRVPEDAASVKAGLAAAAAGDTVLVAAGTWRERALTLPDGVRLHGATGDPADVILDAEGRDRVLFAVAAGAGTGLRGLTFRNGFTTSHGAGVYLRDADVEIADCRFVDNLAGNWGGGLGIQGTSSPRVERTEFRNNRALYGGGVYCESGSPEFTACRFVGNHATHTGGGFQAWYSTCTPRLVDCVFVRNGVLQFSGGGLSAQYAHVSLIGCTLTGNEASGFGSGTGSAIHANRGGSVSLERCLLAFNAGQSAPVGCQGGATVRVSCSDVYGHAAGDWVDCLAPFEGTDGNFSANPEFCHPRAADVSVRGSSPCAPGARACGRVGAGDVGCGALSVQDASWGSVKARWR